MSHSLVSLLFQKVAGVSDGVVRQLQFLSGFTVQDVHPPAPAGISPKPMPADIHSSTFIAAFLAVIDHGMKDAPVMCERGWRTAEKSGAHRARAAGVTEVTPADTRATYAAQVRDTLVLAINAGLVDAMHTFAVESADLCWQHQLLSPPSGGGPSFKPPIFTQLRMLAAS